MSPRLQINYNLMVFLLATIKSPHRLSFRIFYITATLFGFIFLIFYSALFISKLSITSIYTPIKSLDDIKRLKTHQLCVANDTYGIMIFRENVSNDKFILSIVLHQQGEHFMPNCRDF